MTDHFYYRSVGGGRIHGCRWLPEGQVRAVVQIIHGIAEHISRYDAFARYLNVMGIAVVAEDHMGHGGSISKEMPMGCFRGDWFGAVDDSVKLMTDTMEAFPGVPYILFGHSMGSFMARTILAKYPGSGIAAAVICGTGWMPKAVVKAGKTMAELECRRVGEYSPSAPLQAMMFGGYNRRVEHPKSPFDWLSRDRRVVKAYQEDPNCGFIASAGLVRAMMTGILYIQDRENLAKMSKDLPVYFIAGGDDPVGGYGEGVKKAAKAFEEAGMERVDLRLWPLCRHEILNEINRDEIFADVAKWIENVISV